MVSDLLTRLIDDSNGISTTHPLSGGRMVSDLLTRLIDDSNGIPTTHPLTGGRMVVPPPAHATASTSAAPDTPDTPDASVVSPASVQPVGELGSFMPAADAEVGTAPHTVDEAWFHPPAAQAAQTAQAAQAAYSSVLTGAVNAQLRHHGVVDPRTGQQLVVDALEVSRHRPLVGNDVDAIVDAVINERYALAGQPPVDAGP